MIAMSDALDSFAGDDDGSTDDDRPRLAKPGQLDGEYLTVDVASAPEVVPTDYDDAVRFEAEYVESDHGGDWDGEGPFNAGDECAVLTWSKRLVRELQHARDRADGDSLVGERITIAASGDGYDRTYTVDVVDAESDD